MGNIVNAFPLSVLCEWYRLLQRTAGYSNSEGKLAYGRTIFALIVLYVQVCVCVQDSQLCMVCTYKLDTCLRLSDSFYLCLFIKTVSKSLQKCSLYFVLFAVCSLIWALHLIWCYTLLCGSIQSSLSGLLNCFISLVSVAFGLVLFRVRIRIGFSLMLKPNLLSLLCVQSGPFYIYGCVCVFPWAVNKLNKCEHKIDLNVHHTFY